eukprot:GEMP01052608.1.p1 GENE.GEMP01052608.1~~GEMP01052608.1.p1  ORF type:complete len:357 (+),score=77.95 GEMP01052608.1:121-1191(+)
MVEFGRMTPFSARMNSGSQMSEILGKYDARPHAPHTVDDRTSPSSSTSTATPSKSDAGLKNASHVRAPNAGFGNQNDRALAATPAWMTLNVCSPRQAAERNAVPAYCRSSGLFDAMTPSAQRPKVVGEFAHMVAEKQKASTGIHWRQISAIHMPHTTPYPSARNSSMSARSRSHPNLPKETACRAENTPREKTSTTPMVEHWNSSAVKEAMNEGAGPLEKIPEDYAMSSPYALQFPVKLRASPLPFGVHNPSIIDDAAPQAYDDLNRELLQVAQSVPRKRRDYEYNLIKPDVRIVLARSSSLSAPCFSGVLSKTRLGTSSWLISCKTPRPSSGSFEHSVVAHPELCRQRSYVRWKY